MGGVGAAGWMVCTGREAGRATELRRCPVHAPPLPPPKKQKATRLDQPRDARQAEHAKKVAGRAGGVGGGGWRAWGTGRMTATPAGERLPPLPPPMSSHSSFQAMLPPPLPSSTAWGTTASTARWGGGGWWVGGWWVGVWWGGGRGGGWVEVEVVDAAGRDWARRQKGGAGEARRRTGGEVPARIAVAQVGSCSGGAVHHLYGGGCCVRGGAGCFCVCA